MEVIFEIIQSIGGVLASFIVIIVFFEKIIIPFFFKLELLLTKDLFFRLTDLGETFFLKVIVHAPTNIQIIDFNFELKGQKKDTQETSYKCKAEQFGSVERNTINEHSMASFYLPKHSPEFLLKKGESKEILIKCNIVGSKKEIKKSIASLWYDYQQFSSSQPNTVNTQKNFEHSLKERSTEILSNIKIESGTHTLVCKISYKYKHFFKLIEKKAESRVNINITESSLNLYKNKLSIETFLFDFLSALNPRNSNVKIRYPEISLRFD